MANKLFKSFFALAMVVGSALGFVACEEQGDDVVGNPTVEVSTKSLNFAMEEGSQDVNITANSDWKVEVDVDWVTVTPANGTGDAKITVAVAMNDTGAARETTVKVIALHKTYGNWETKKITVKQSASNDAPVTEVLLYGDNFDGKEAQKDSNGYWPYIDQFPEFANPEGPAAENVTYSGSVVSVRANSTSNSSYSDYAGSGSNNIFFGSGAYFQVNDITLDATQVNYKMTFGSEKYSKDGDSTFKPEEFIVSISKNGTEWAPVEYTYAGTEPGRWNVATADFTLAAGTDKLYIKFEAKVASVYRLDDVKFYVGNGGQTIDLDNIEAPQPSEATKVTVAEFLNAAEDSTIYELTGKITNVTNTTYGNFYINDGTGEVLIYGLCSPTGEQKYWAESGAKVGDTITVQTVRTSYNGTPQGKNAIFVSLVPGEGGEEPTPEPAEGPYASDVAFVCATDDSTNAAYTLGATTINGQAVTGFKLGKTKQAGKFTSAAVGVSGDKYLNFYAQGWKGGDVTLYFRVDGGATMSQKLASHDGVTGNPPFVSLAFADTDHYSFKLEGLTASSTIEFSTDANFALTSSDSAMDTARAVVCGIKLTDEALTPGEGGGDEPETPVTPEGVVTIAEAITAADGASIVIENATVIGVYARGVLVEDATGKLLVYAGSAISANVGDVVKVEGAMATYGGLRQVATPAVTVTGSTTYTYPTATVMNGAAMDAYLSNPVIDYVEYTGTLAISGYYYNVTVDGAATAVGSLAYVIEGTVDPALDGQQILVKGWTIGFSGGKYVNTMITSVTAAGSTEPTPEPEPTPDGVVKATVEEFLAAAEDDTVYELTGVIKNVANTNYGNFDLQDETGTVYVYGIYDEDGNKVFTSLGLKEGDTLTMRGVRTSYQDNPQVGSGVYVSHVSAPEQEQPANEATLSFTDDANRVSWDSNQQVWSANGITLTNNKGASTSNVADFFAPARFYKSSEIIVECEKAMTKIEFACNGASYATALQSSLGSTPSTIDGSSVIVEFDTATTSFTIASLTGGQVRMNSLKVTFAE